MVVYIGANESLDLVAWDESCPAFHVSDLSDVHQAVRSRFQSTHVYYVGSHEGCGCGFQYGEYPDLEDPDRDLKKASLEAFAAYLSRQLQRVDAIELYACWDGDQTARPEHQRTLTPALLRSNEFYFLEKEYSRVLMG